MVTRRRGEDEERDDAADAAAVDETEDKKTIWVRSKLPAKKDGGHPVAVFDQDPSHPNNGQAYVAGPKPVEVAPTAAITAAIREERIEELTASEAKAATKKIDEAAAKAREEAKAAQA